MLKHFIKGLWKAQVQLWDEFRNGWKQFLVFMIICCSISAITGLTVNEIMFIIVVSVSVLVFLYIIICWLLRDKGE